MERRKGKREKDTHRSALLTWNTQTSAAETAYQGHANAAYLGRTGGWTGADVGYTHDAATRARQMDGRPRRWAG